MNSTELKLKERIKELNCLYELSRIASNADNDLNAIVSKTLELLPAAMQFPEVAEAFVEIGAVHHMTPSFAKTKVRIESDLTYQKKRYGRVAIGYKVSSAKRHAQASFLAEEKSLLKTVARELSLFIQRATVEEEKQKLKMQLQHAERLAFVGELSAGIAHELNEPLGRILGFAQLVKKGGALNEQQGEDVERIIKASLYTREIIKKLMIFSRQMPPQITNVDLNAIIDNILYFIDVRFQSRNIVMRKQLDPRLPAITADEVQMSQVIVNLITNAVHAMPKGGEVIIATRQKGNHVALSVKDTGMGMTADIKAKIFEPFFTTKPVGQGTGLGLSVVQGIIDSHAGKILVSSAPSKGTKFEILLPIKPKK